MDATGRGGPMASWKVTGHYDTNDIQPGGQFTPGKTVMFVTGNGHKGSVFVADSQWTPEKVAALVQAQANIADAVGNLSSGM